ncbi:MAG: hypothetical protein ACOC2H_09845 [Spirochaetota bacterium]
MSTLHVYKDVHIQMPYKRIMARLGYNVHHTVIDETHMDRINSVMESGSVLCSNTAIWRTVAVTVSGPHVVLDATHQISSASLAEYLGSARYGLLMFGSCGKKLSDEIEKAVNEKKLVKAAIYDALGSETADGILDWIQHYCRRTLLRTYGHVSRRRFSPGYGDLSLSYQQTFYTMLNLSGHGIEINDRFILSPEKSVSAICKIG